MSLCFKRVKSFGQSLFCPYAANNALGGWLGAKLAINKGNGFIRVFFW
jgi:hypothetical protein